MKSFNRIRVLNQIVCEIISQKSLENATIADVGTDHGYLAELLSRSDNITKIIATDISKKSLEKTIQLIKQNNLTKIETKLGDGLTPIDSADIVVLAGIGGYEIINMLSNQNITKTGGNKCEYFVLQPTKNFVELRRFLIEKNYKIERDFITKSGGKFYPIICVNLLEKNDSKGDLFCLYFGETNDIENKDFFEFLLDTKNKLEFLEKLDKNKVNNDADLQVKFELLLLAKSLIKKYKGEK